MLTSNGIFSTDAANYSALESEEKPAQREKMKATSNNDTFLRSIKPTGEEDWIAEVCYPDKHPMSWNYSKGIVVLGYGVDKLTTGVGI
eukprot:CAMPEP_0118699134 /NCGR_PEP_ID=MMETSP0800-20121206/15685_1 /TAXON_ID=210618 ORGANISM="Striatella unipunctata, Strain CCMP2910" /NCGR_SAMPLE_ID=MMETSP0800 /ASSEMBLY_ACC=CAM_ASM_000638 /LENGTH=87 /DNA_ID=CAMNT_0006599227 /DNA_START=953 /DNA_END=1216 /DNA_ORIENTATION=-